jgi:RNA-binding protein YlmH
MENFIDYAKNREEQLTKIQHDEKDLITFEDLREYYDDWVKLNLLHSSLTLPNIYEGSLNSKRIKVIKEIKVNWRVEKSTISQLFCEGADWYKKQVESK